MLMQYSELPRLFMETVKVCEDCVSSVKRRKSTQVRVQDILHKLPQNFLLVTVGFLSGECVACQMCWSEGVEMARIVYAMFSA